MASTKNITLARTGSPAVVTAGMDSTRHITWASTSSPAVVTADMASTRHNFPREIFYTAKKARELSNWTLLEKNSFIFTLSPY
jgi:hypothetical protein